VEASQSDEDSHGGMEGLKTLTPDIAAQQEVPAEVTGEDGQTYPVSMYAAVGNNTSPAGMFSILIITKLVLTKCYDIKQC
jgi:hypothetical protein